MTTLDEESLIVTNDGFKWANYVFACIKYKAYELGENLGPSKSIFCRWFQCSLYSLCHF